METNNKQREALESCLDFIMRLDRAFNPIMQNLLEGAIAKAEAALAAPPRNCEVGTAEEQAQRFDAFCQAHKYVGDDGTNWCSDNCPCFKSGIDCGVLWDQMQYEEEGAK